MKNLKIFALITALIMCFTACGKSAIQQDWQEQFDLGVRFLNEDNYEEAIIAFEAAIKIDPKLPEAYIGLADVYIEKGDMDKAREILEKGLENNPDNEDIRSRVEELEPEVTTTAAAATVSSAETEITTTEQTTVTTQRASEPVVTVASSMTETAKPEISTINKVVEYENARIEVKNGKFWAYLTVPDLQESYEVNVPGTSKYIHDCNFGIEFTDSVDTFTVSTSYVHRDEAFEKVPLYQMHSALYHSERYNENDDYMTNVQISFVGINVTDKTIMWVFDIPDGYNLNVENLKITKIIEESTGTSLKNLMASDTSYRAVKASEITFLGSSLRELSVESAKTLLEQKGYGGFYQSADGAYLSAWDKTFDSKIVFSKYSSGGVHADYNSEDVTEYKATPTPLPIGVRNIYTLDSTETVFRKLGFSNSRKLEEFIEETASMRFQSREEAEEKLEKKMRAAFDLDITDSWEERIDIKADVYDMDGLYYDDIGTYALYNVELEIRLDGNGTVKLIIGARDGHDEFINKLISCEIYVR